MFEGLEKRVSQRGIVSYWKEGKVLYKQCSDCRETKEIEAFGKNKCNKDKHQGECKECRKKRREKDKQRQNIPKYTIENKNGIEIVTDKKGVISYLKNGILIAKKCIECGKIKETKEFQIRDKKKNTYRNTCKECEKKRNKKYYEANKERITKDGKLRYENNKEYMKECRKLRYENNKEEILKRAKIYREEHKEYNKDYLKKWREVNGDKIKEYNTQRVNRYREENVLKITNMLEQIRPIFEEMNLPTYGIIYKITNKNNNRCYIGQTTQPLKQRYSGNMIKTWIKERKGKINQKFKEELVEENFEIDELLDVGCCKYHLNKLEAHYINCYNSCNEGYNNINGKHNDDDGIEEFENILNKYGLEFINGELRRICDE